MTLALIAAIDRNRAIGRDGRIPWRLSGDMRFFKDTTMGKPIVMGRKTWDSLGRPLPGRRNIVLTRDPSFRAQGAEVVHSPDEAMALASDAAETMVIGGGEIYRLFLPLAERIYLTRVDTVAEGADAWFPALTGDWQETLLAEQPADEKNSHPYTIVRLERRLSGS